MEIRLTDSPNCINIQKTAGDEPIRICFEEGDKSNVLRVSWYATGKRKWTEFILSPDTEPVRFLK
jgi:hypothetical protein